MEWKKVPSIINLAKNITPDGVDKGSIHYKSGKNITPDGVDKGSIHYKSGKKHHSGWSG